MNKSVSALLSPLCRSGVLLLDRHLQVSWRETAYLRHHRSRICQHHLHHCLCKWHACFSHVVLHSSVCSTSLSHVSCAPPALPRGEGRTEDSPPPGTGWDGGQCSGHDRLPPAGEFSAVTADPYRWHQP